MRLGASPASSEIQNLDDWQTGLIYETAMSYPEEWLRRGFFEQKKSASNFDDEDMLKMGYSAKEIAAIKGKG